MHETLAGDGDVLVVKPNRVIWHVRKATDIDVEVPDLDVSPG